MTKTSQGRLLPAALVVRCLHPADGDDIRAVAEFLTMFQPDQRRNIL